MPTSSGERRCGSAFDNPKLSDPTLRLAAFDYDQRTIDGSAELFQQYEIFVDTILNASDEILGVAPTKEWKASVRIQLKPHSGYLQSEHFRTSGYLDQYSATLRAFLAEILNEPPLEPSTPVKPSVARIGTPNQRASQACLSSSSTAKRSRCRTASP